MATLAGTTISSAYKSLLKINDTTNGLDASLEVIEDGLGNDSPLSLALTKLLIKPSSNNDNMFEVQNQSGHKFITANMTTAPAVIINEDGEALIDFRVETDNSTTAIFVDSSINKTYFSSNHGIAFEVGPTGVIVNSSDNVNHDFTVSSNGEDQALLVDAGSNFLSINHGETAFTTEIHSVDGEAISVSATEVIVNNDGIGTVDFRVESLNGPNAIFVDASEDIVHINSTEAAVTTQIHNDNDVALSVTAAGVVINEDANGAVDFRVESANEDEAIFLDAGSEILYINRGNTNFTTLIENDNSEAIRVNAAGVVFNENHHVANDFRIESDTQTHAFFLDAGADSGKGYIGMGVSDPDAPLEIFNTGTQFKLSYDASDWATFGVDSSGDLTITSKQKTIITSDNTAYGLEIKNRSVLLGGNDGNNPQMTFTGSSNDLTVQWDQDPGLLLFDSGTFTVDGPNNAVFINAGVLPTRISNGLSLTHDLEIRGGAGTGAASAGVLALTTAETTIVATDVLGAIVFQAPLEADGTDGILAGAAIQAVAGAEFTASVNDTDLVFSTANSEAATEKMRIHNDGTVTTSGPTVHTRLAVTNLAADGEIPITATCVNIDANGSARAGIRFAGTGTAGQMIIVNNTGAETLQFHGTEGTALVRGIHADHDFMSPNGVYIFISDGSLWNYIGGGVDTQPELGLAAS